jgi:hypothetical protein
MGTVPRLSVNFKTVNHPIYDGTCTIDHSIADTLTQTDECAHFGSAGTLPVFKISNKSIHNDTFSGFFRNRGLDQEKLNTR